MNETIRSELFLVCMAPSAQGLSLPDTVLASYNGTLDQSVSSGRIALSDSARSEASRAKEHRVLTHAH